MLAKLLDANSRFALNHRGTTNHLPMALVALARMGADDGRLKAYFDWWERDIALPRGGDEPKAGRDNWREFIGVGAAFAPLSDTFRSWIETEGADAVLAEVAPALTGFPGAGAFHAVIRLAYGLDAGHPGEIAAGLAAWVAGQKPLGLADLMEAAPRTASAAEGLSRIADAVGGRPPIQGFITTAMATIAGDPAFRAAVTLPPADDAGALLPLLAEAAVRLWWQVPNFTLLHLVTGTHAARIVAEAAPALADKTFARALWGDWCAAYATVGAPRFEDAPVTGPAAEWPAIFAAAVASDDDHVIKLAWTCKAESDRYAGDSWRMAATRVTGLS